MRESPLEKDAAAVWLVDVLAAQQDADHLAACRAILSLQEDVARQRLRTPFLQTRYTLVRGILRRLLGDQLAIPPERVPLVTNAYGRPGLAAFLKTGLQFNVSYSAHLALITLTWDVQIGVDIEQKKLLPDSEMTTIVARWFSAQELAQWQRLLPADRLQGFYTGWTRKEAIIKALGLGLSYPLQQFSVTLTPDADPRLLFIEGQANNSVIGWQLHDIAPNDDFAAALAWQGPPRRISCRRWTGH